MSVFSDLVLAVDPPVQQAFLGALIGGIFGRSKAKKQAAAAEEAARIAEEQSKVPMVTEQEHTVDLAGMNAAAIAAGYNPMTLLMAGGLSGFTTSKSTTTGHNAMAVAEAKGTALQARASVPSFGEVLAGSAGSVLDGMVSGGLSAKTRGTSYFPPAPQAVSPVVGIASALGIGKPGFGAAGGGGAQFGVAATMGSGAPMTPVIKAPETVNPWRRFKIDPTSPGADAFTQRYGEGELSETLAFGLTAWDDVWYNTTGMTSDERYNSFGKPVVNGAKSAIDSVKTGVMSSDPKAAALSVGGAVWGAEKWFRRNVYDVWWPN